MYDDEAQIVGNQLIEHWKYVPYYFNMQVWAHINPNAVGNYYRPIFMLWMRINHALFEFHPLGWHLTTVLFHLLATFMVFRLARRLSSREDIAFIAALVFGLHPAHIEAVAWVSGVTESLFAVLLLGAFLGFLNWREGKNNARAWSLLLFALAIFSKETSVLMLPLIFAYCWLNPREDRPTIAARFWTSLVPTFPYVAVTMAYLGLRYVALNGLSHPLHELSLRVNLLTIPSVLWFYLKMLVVPVGLSAFYDTPYVTSPDLHHFWIPLLAVIVAATGLFFWWWKTRDRLVAFASVLLVLPLLPLLNFTFFFDGEIAHDRYLYVPSIGFALLVAIAITRLKSSRTLWMVTAAVAAVFLCLTIWQSLYWADNLVLYSRGVNIAPNNNLALNNLANETQRRGMLRQATALYARILDRNPSFYWANYNLAYALFQEEKYSEAAHFFRRAASLDASDAGTFYYLGQCEMHLGRLDFAEAAFRRAIATDSRLLGPRYMLGLVLKQQGRTREALDYFRAELTKNPNDANARKEADAIASTM
ncbi:MAG TPA: tetratricopeptide repeat protein [Terriglobales bacterium]|nr:tetratricopeptide repeat protein [Terriglobales bacterium]